MMFNSCKLYQLRVFSSTVKQEAEREEHYDRLLPLPIWQREQKEKAKKLLKEEKKKGRGDEEKRHGEVKQDQKETRRHRKDEEKKGEKKEKIRRRGNRALERKGRDCARDEGARI
ncbi:unnamed protein product, partial [Pocillopora meandrina]